MNIQQVETYEKQAEQEKYFHRVAVALDIFLNVATGGRPDETISSRVRRISDAYPSWKCWPNVGLAKAMNWGLNCIQRNHGLRAAAGDLERACAEENVEKKELGL